MCHFGCILVYRLFEVYTSYQPHLIYTACTKTGRFIHGLCCSRRNFQRAPVCGTSQHPTQCQLFRGSCERHEWSCDLCIVLVTNHLLAIAENVSHKRTTHNQSATLCIRIPANGADFLLQTTRFMRTCGTFYLPKRVHGSMVYTNFVRDVLVFDIDVVSMRYLSGRILAKS